MTRRSRNALTIRTEEDVLALVPFTLGFVPEDSLVLIAVDPSGTLFQGRIDLPDDHALLDVAVAQLVEPAARNGGRRALVVVYSDDHGLALEATGQLREALERHRMEPVLALRADGRRWYRLSPDDPRACEGVPYDLRSHPLTTRSVFEGRVTHASRRDLADSVCVVDPEAVEEVTAEFSALPPLPEGTSPRAAKEGRELVDLVRTLLDRDEPPDPGTAARLLRGVRHQGVRDLLWCDITRSTAPRHVILWRSVVTRSPEELVAPAAGLLAFAAWLAGDGALAWCAVDRSLQADPDHGLASLVARALEGAVPPSSWHPLDPSTLPLAAR